MDNFHEQAMSSVYQQVLHRLLGFFSRSERIALQLLIQRVLVAAGGVERIGRYRVMVVHVGARSAPTHWLFCAPRSSVLRGARQTRSCCVLRYCASRG